MMILTNNMRVKEALDDTIVVEYLDADLLKLFGEIKNRVHRGQKLLSHPLSGSIKPNENPYKSVIIDEDERSGITDVESVLLIENAITTAEKFLSAGLRAIRGEEEKSDFAMIDLSLIKSALVNLR